MKIRYIHRRANQKNFRCAVPQSYLVSIKPLPDIVFFVHRVPWKLSRWSVSEALSGARVASESDTRHDAITAAEIKLEFVTPKEFTTRRKRAIKFIGDLTKLPKYDA